jgi:transposase-like protein
MNYRSFNKEFKKRVIEEIIAGVSRPVEVCRRYNIAAPVLYRWKKAYLKGEYTEDILPGLSDRSKIKQLERKLGQVAMENDILKKALKHITLEQEKNGYLLTPIEEESEILLEDAEP